MNKLVVVILLTSLPLHAADWPVARGDAAMTGVADTKLPDQLQEFWTFKTGNSIDSAPVIVGDTVYVSSGDKHLYALELKTGKPIWKTNLEAPLKAAPAVDKGVVYVANSDGKLFAVEAATGKVKWNFEAQGEVTAGANFHNGNILFGSHDNTLYCLSPLGKKLWEFKIDGPVNGSPAVVGDRTFVAGCDSMLHVLDANTGKSQGSVDLGGQAGATAAVVGNSVYVGTMSNTVVAVDWKNLKKQWSFEAPRRQQPFYSSAAVTENSVLVGSRDKKLYALDRFTGKEQWSFITEGQVDGSPLVVGNRVYIGSQNSDGHFFVLDLKTGKKLQMIELDSAVNGSPAAGPNCVIVGTEKGTLYCFGDKI
ncbi:PQQ-binding-like beta-propeller repeat protein [soil metagenome]